MDDAAGGRRHAGGGGLTSPFIYNSVEESIMPAEKSSKAPARKRAPVRTSMDINQLELALVNRALDGDEVPPDADIGGNERVLKIQQRNLRDLCRELNRESGKAELEAMLLAILDGGSVLSIGGFAPKHERALAKRK